MHRPLSEFLFCVDRFTINIIFFRNSCFDVPSHKAFLDEDQVNLLPYILLPICGPEEFPEDVGLFIPFQLFQKKLVLILVLEL